MKCRLMNLKKWRGKVVMRLTKVDRYGHFYTNKAYCRNIWSLDGKKLEGEFFENQTLAIDGDAIDKLGELEDIEEELGIDLITLFNAYHCGFYIKYENGFIGFIRGGQYYLEVGLETKCFIVKEFEPNGTRWYFKDYGKTWALTKEELL